MMLIFTQLLEIALSYGPRAFEFWGQIKDNMNANGEVSVEDVDAARAKMPAPLQPVEIKPQTSTEEDEK